MVIDATNRFEVARNKAMVERSAKAKQALLTIARKNPSFAEGLASVVRKELENRDGRAT